MDAFLKQILKSFFILLDSLFAVLLVLLSFLMYPISYLRNIDKCLNYAKIICSQRLATAVVRAFIDLRLGYYGKAIVQYETIISKLEHISNKAKFDKVLIEHLLAEMYSSIAHAHLLGGHIDAAMLVIIRAYNKLGLQRLKGLGELDVKTAHIIRAGLSAGRLLEEGGLAALLVRPANNNPKSPRNAASSKRFARSRYANKDIATSKNRIKDGSPLGMKSKNSKSSGSKNQISANNIIPFPSGNLDSKLLDPH